jgi:ubiquinone/menaquinone biosynthesis C-methylase UbiE
MPVMSDSSEDTNVQAASVAFSKQAGHFDEIYSKDLIVQYKRQRVRAHIQPFLQKNCQVLELNSGTGEDALWFALQGLRVHATDISPKMQEVLIGKKLAAGLDRNITTEICSFSQLKQLSNKGPYDIIFSNFAGLDCTGDLKKVLSDLSLLNGELPAQ